MGVAGSPNSTAEGSTAAATPASAAAGEAPTFTGGMPWLRLVRAAIGEPTKSSKLPARGCRGAREVGVGAEL